MRRRAIRLVGTICASAAVLFLATARPAFAAVIWEPLAPFVDPRTRSGIEGAAASIVGDKIYVSHGFRFLDTAFLSIYDIPSDTWTHGGVTAPDAVVVRSEGAGGTSGGLHYSIGGRPGVVGPGDAVEEFTPGGAWAAMDAMLTPRRGLGTASLGGLIYAAGGSDGGSPGAGIITGAFEVFDPSAAAGLQWTALAPMLIPLMDIEATIGLGAAESGTLGGAVYVFGGRDAGGFIVPTVQIFDIASGTWGFGTDMPTARSNAMAGLIAVGAVEDGMIAVYGGADVGFLNLVVTELYDPITDSWIAGPDMLFATSEHAVGALSDTTGVYAIGSGIFGASSTVVERLVFIPEPSTVLLLACGLAGLAVQRRRRTR